ncbi:hypothetical protein ANMWB30_24190 [Arthrobacter sp. MWB30]|nr:hypothetical protein ANMWB30_24190 [Arthrobacter sp. MWB30]
MLTGVVTGYLAVNNTLWLSGELQAWQAAGQRPPVGPLVGLIVIIVGFGLVSIAGVFVGIWNLRETKSTDPRPLRSAIVVSMVSFVLMMTFLGGPLNDPAKIVFPILHAIVAAWTVGILRLKKVPVSPAAVVV